MLPPSLSVMRRRASSKAVEHNGQLLLPQVPHFPPGGRKALFFWLRKNKSNHYQQIEISMPTCLVLFVVCDIWLNKISVKWAIPYHTMGRLYFISILDENHTKSTLHVGELHLGRLSWNLQITHLAMENDLNQTSMRTCSSRQPSGVYTSPMDYMGYKTPPIYIYIYIEPVTTLQPLFWPALKPSQGALGQPPGISKMRTFGSVTTRGYQLHFSFQKKKVQQPWSVGP